MHSWQLKEIYAAREPNETRAVRVQALRRITASPTLSLASKCFVDKAWESWPLLSPVWRNPAPAVWACLAGICRVHCRSSPAQTNNFRCENEASISPCQFTKFASDRLPVVVPEQKGDPAGSSRRRPHRCRGPSIHLACPSWPPCSLASGWLAGRSRLSGNAVSCSCCQSKNARSEDLRYPTRPG